MSENTELSYKLQVLTIQKLSSRSMIPMSMDSYRRTGFNSKQLVSCLTSCFTVDFAYDRIMLEDRRKLKVHNVLKNSKNQSNFVDSYLEEHNINMYSTENGHNSVIA